MASPRLGDFTRGGGAQAFVLKKCRKAAMQDKASVGWLPDADGSYSSNSEVKDCIVNKWGDFRCLRNYGNQ